MDFARPHRLEDGVATRSKIRLLTETLPPTDGGDDHEMPSTSAGADAASGEGYAGGDLDGMLLSAANRAAKDLFLGPPLTRPRLDPSANNEDDPTSCVQEERRLRLADSRLYPERCLAPSHIIAPHSLVVIFESFDSLSFAYATPGQVFSNRNGHFAHNDFIGKPYGCKIRSRSSGGLGYVYLLRPTPELWSRSLPHRTQIIHELDAAVIVCQLNLRPNCVVCESGTGSGSMSHSILRTIAPHGKLHTFEFNRGRVEAARKEFEKNGVSHLVDVHWRDVCGKKDGMFDDAGDAAAAAPAASTAGDDTSPDQTRIEKGGFGLGHAKAHAIFLDLPEPWLAVPHAAHTIVPGGRIGSYSPCIEQSQKLVAAIGKYGFHSARTVEVRLREHFVDEIEMEPPPTARLPRDPPSVAPGATSASVTPTGGSVGMDNVNTPTSNAERSKTAAQRVPSPVSGNTSTAVDFSGEDTGAEADTERSEAETEGEPQRADALVAAAREAQDHGSDLAPIIRKGKNGGGGHHVAWDDSAAHSNDNGNGLSSAAIYDGTKKRKVLVARPFATMRGHTAFLTFATAGNRMWPDPNSTV